MAWFYAGGAGGALDNAANWWADAGHSVPYGSVPSGVDVQLDDTSTGGTIAVAACYCNLPESQQIWTSIDLTGSTFSGLLTIANHTAVIGGSAADVLLKDVGSLQAGTFTNVTNDSANGGTDDGGSGGPTITNFTQTAACTGALDAGTVTNAVINGGGVCLGGPDVHVTNLTMNAGSVSATGSGTLYVRNLTLRASWAGGSFAMSCLFQGNVVMPSNGSITLVCSDSMPLASDVRAGIPVGVSPAVGTLTAPAVTDVRYGVSYWGNTGSCRVPASADVRLGTAVDVSPTVGTCAVPAASDVRLGVAVGATTGTLLTYTDPANPADMPDEHSIAFQEMLAEFGITYTFGGFSFLCVESDVSQSLEPILEGDFKNDSAPIIALKTAFNACPSGTPEIGDILVDPDGREFRVKSLRTSKDDVTIQFELTDIHDRG